MSSPWRKSRLRLGYRTPEAVPSSAPASVPLTLNPPPALVECATANITWTGGMPPYTVEANFNFEGSSLQFATGFLALGMYTTQLLWNTNVLAGFLVSFHVIDTLGVDSVTSDPIRVGALSGPPCSLVAPPSLTSSSPVTGTALTPIISTFSGIGSAFDDYAPSTSVLTAFPSATVAPGIVTAPTSALLPSSTSSPLLAEHQQGKLLSGTSIALIALGVVAFLLLATFPWWRSCITPRKRKREGRDDTEKQDIADGGNGGGRADLQDNAESAGRRSTDPSDCPAAPTENPFENPENIVYTDQNFSVSYFEDRDRTPMRSPVINSPPSTVPDVDTPISVAPRPLRPKVTQRLERAPSTSAQSDSDMRTLSDTDAARLSMSTSSTLPPSYRTRGSAGSIYVPMPDHPPFPPPVYTPQPTYTPIPRRLSTPRKVPRRRVPAPAPRKVRDDQSARSISAERESRGDRNTGEGERIEGTVTSDSRDS